MIRVNELSFHYADQSSLFENFDFQINEGDLFGLVGPNGAGKSSLIALLCGLQRAQSGTILVDGFDLRSQRKQVVRNISVVPQEYAFYPKLSARENLNFFASLYKNKQRQHLIDKSIELSGIGAFVDRQARYYSGGMKRRLNLAIGLLNKPRLLILDEPTVGIDPQSRHFILNAIREINAQGTTVLYTSHYMEEVEQLCNQLAIIDHGKILAAGSLTELLGNNCKLTITIRNFNKLTVADLTRIKHQYQLELENNNGVGHLRGEIQHMSTCTDIANELIKLGADITQLRCGEQSLEQLFFALTDTALRED